MGFPLALLAIATTLVCFAIHSSHLSSECEVKREAALKLVEEQKRDKNLNLAIVVPNCNTNGTYATHQCHYSSNFCQCWDKEGIPLTQPKKNLKECGCMVKRANILKSIPAAQNTIPDMPSCENDGSYTAKQCDSQACWCVDQDTGEKLGSGTEDKSNLRC